MTEQDYWPAVCEAWHNRARELELNPKTKRYADQQLAFLQGALAVATATGVMPMGRAHTLALLACVGRGEMVLPEPKPVPVTE